MSRNKDIKALHEITGEPYSVCRAKMKAAHWNLDKALGFSDALKFISEMTNTILDGIPQALEDLAHGLGDYFISVGETLKNVKFTKEV